MNLDNIQQETNTTIIYSQLSVDEKLILVEKIKDQTDLEDEMILAIIEIFENVSQSTSLN